MMPVAVAQEETPPGTRQTFRSAVLACTVAAFLAIVALRAWGLQDKSLWFEEAFTFSVAVRPFGEIASFVRANDAHPPLYYLLTHAVTPLWSREVDVRLLSVVAGSLAVLALYLFGRRLLGPRQALVAAGLMALSPAHVMASQEGRMYALLGLLVLLSWGCLWLAVRGDRRLWPAYALASAAALYTHYLSVPVMLSQGLYILADPSARRAFRSWLLAACAALAFFLPWVTAAVDQMVAGRILPEIRPGFSLLPLAELGALWQFGGGLYQTTAYIPHRRGDLPLVYYIPLLAPVLVVLTAAILGLWRGQRSHLLLTCFFLLPVALIVFVPLGINPAQIRYAVVFIPAYVLLAAVGVEQLAEWWQARGGRAVWVRGFMLLWLGLFAAAGLEAHYKATTWDGYNWRAGVSFVDGRVAQLDTLAVIPGVINIPYQVYSRRVRLAVLGDPMTWLDPAQSREREVQRRVLREAAARGAVWLLTLAPVADPVAAGLSTDLQGLVAERERKTFGSFVVIHFARPGNR